jgi:hypothetical protein
VEIMSSLVQVTQASGSMRYYEVSEGEAAQLASVQPGDRVFAFGKDWLVDWTCSDGRCKLVDRNTGTSVDVDTLVDEAEARQHLRRAA